MYTYNGFQVYRLFSESDELLYVGCSKDTTRRMFNHSDKGWFSEVVRATFEHFNTAEEASTAERIAICTENPRYNKAIGNYARQTSISGSPGAYTLNRDEAALIDTYRLAVRKAWEAGYLQGWKGSEVEEPLAA